MNVRPKVYLGDSVYASTEPWGMVTLTTENGLPGDPSNVIHLEPEVLMALWDYCQQPAGEEE